MTFLFDVNLLIALLWENHEHHQTARAWLRRVTAFTTCPVSQLGFARVSSHPLLGYSMSPDQAFDVLRRFLSDDSSMFSVERDSGQPDGRKRIAQRFIAGSGQPGAAESRRDDRNHGIRLSLVSGILSSLRDLRAADSEPSDKSLGYFHLPRWGKPVWLRAN